jgi:tRNA(Arg) A34 adenosine deaminase TadA/ADP-ribose pyrophosphatase YjhB (NUDIX family)
MALPYKIATLLYCFNRRDEVLLLERAQEPNLGHWSPCGGKLKTDLGESPYACACREAGEEIGLQLQPADLHLNGLVSEHSYQGQAHWLMFLFEVKPRLEAVPPPIREGRFAFFPRAELERLQMPVTDREMIWPLFWRHRGGFFAAHCHTQPGGRNVWTVEETKLRPRRNGSESATPVSPVSPQPLDRKDAAIAPVIDLHSDDHFMGEALRQARRAADKGEVPVGAVVVREGRIIARAFNQVELLRDATAHAEMLALTQAQAAVGDWRLNDCTLYVTKEPCPMCAGAVVHARLGRVVFGASDPKGGAAGGALNLLQFPGLNHHSQITPGVKLAECREMLRQFFAAQRQGGER